MTKTERERKHRDAKQRILERVKLWQALESNDAEKAVQAAIFLGKKHLGQDDPDDNINH